MTPNVTTTPWPAEIAFRAQQVVYDLVYNPPRSRLLIEAERAGCQVIGGLEMLIAQAQAQFEWWTGMRPAERRNVTESMIRPMRCIPSPPVRRSLA